MTDQALARCFGRAARSYEAATRVQPQAARRLLQLAQAQDQPLPAGAALDLGCATAALAPTLRRAFPEQAFMGIDIAEAMLQQARLLGRNTTGYRLLCADATRLPIATASVALVFTSFAFQWLTPTDALAEVARVLRPGGMLALAVPLAGSLAEMRASWQSVDGEPRLNALPELRAWLDAASLARLDVVEVRQQLLQEFATDAMTLLHRIKASGAQRRTSATPVLSSRRRFAAFADAYERFRGEAGLPMSWQVGYLLCRRG